MTLDKELNKRERLLQTMLKLSSCNCLHQLFRDGQQLATGSQCHKAASHIGLTVFVTSFTGWYGQNMHGSSPSFSVIEEG